MKLKSLLLGIKNSLLYSLMVGTSSMVYNLFITYVQYFYTDIIQLSSHWVGRGWFLFGLWNTINDPLSGWLSDKIKARFGRRKYLLAALIIPVTLTFALIWAPIVSDSKLQVFIYFLVIISIFDVLHTMLDNNLGAILPEAYKTMHERVNISMLNNVLILVLAGLAVSFAPVVYDALGWVRFGIFFALIATSLLVLGLFGIREPHRDEHEAIEQVSLFANLKDILATRFITTMIAIQFFARMMLAVTMTTLPFYAKYSLGLSGVESGILTGSLFVSIGLGFPFWRSYMLRHGSQKTMAKSLLFAAAASLFLLIPVHKYLVIALMAVFGSLAAGSQLAPTVMTAETIDKDNRHGLKYREGMIIGLMGMAIRFPPAISGLLIGELLKLAAYDSSLAVSMQPDTVNWTLRIFFALGLVLSSLATYYFNSRNSLKK